MKSLAIILLGLFLAFLSFETYAESMPERTEPPTFTR